MTTHFQHSKYSSFSACMFYSGQMTNKCIETTCFNCMRTDIYRAALRDQRSKIPQTREFIRNNLYSNYEFIGVTSKYNKNKRRQLIKYIRTADGEFVADHAWVDNCPDMRNKLLVRFKATCIWYRRKDRSQNYSLKYIK